jgi:hypothetical protein
MLKELRGPLAHAFKLSGSEWRQDFLCGPNVMTMMWRSTRDLDIQQAGCNPDSPDRYMCDLALSTCTDVNGTRPRGGGIRFARRPHPATSIDYRKRQHWEWWRALPVPDNFLIEKHVVLFESNTHAFTFPGGGSENMLLDGFLQFFPQENKNASLAKSAANGVGTDPLRPPRWYYINMDTHRERGKRLEASLLKGSVRPIDITRISAVTPQHIDNRAWTVPGTGKDVDVERAVTLSHLRAIKRAWEDNQLRSRYGLPMVPAMIVEDDISMELVALWKNEDASRRSITLHDVLQALEVEHPGWEIVQLATTCFTVSECKTYILEMADALKRNIFVLTRKSRKRHTNLWGAVANAVSPKGQRRILDRLWPGGSQGPAFEALPKGAKFKTNKDVYVVADSVLFRATRRAATFFSSRPLFCSRTEHSHIHDDHLVPQERSKYLMESVLYAEK